MDAKQVWFAGSGRRMVAVAVHVGVVLSLVAGGSPVQAEVREAVKRALPATVGVEWHDAAVRATAAKPVAPPAGDDSTANAYRTKALTVLRRSALNQVNMASGTIVSADGLVVTMLGAHEGGKYSVTLSDGRAVPARLVVDDRRSGLQLLKADAAGLPFLVPARQPPQIGEEVIWTYCLGLKERAAARGIIAATGRDLQGLGTNLLQLDAGVPQMSAGAPLVDEQGRLVGIIAFSRVAESQRTSFAVPGSAVQMLLDARRGDELAVVQRGMLGIALSRPGNEGPVVAHPTTDSPAAAAGVRDGDEILVVDGVKVGSPEEITRLVGAHSAGQKVKLTVRRDGKELEFEVTLAQGPGVGSSGSGSSTGSVSGSGSGTASVATTAPKAGWSAVRPDSIYIVDSEGKLRALPIDPADKSFESLRKFYDSVYKVPHDAVTFTPKEAQVAVPSIQIQRSDVEKKLEEIGRDVLTLRQQMEKLTEEMQRLQKQLAGEKTKP